MEMTWQDDGRQYHLGCLPRVTEPGDGIFPIVGDPGTIQQIPRDEWADMSLEHHVWDIKDQGPQNSCCPTAYAGLLQTVREAQGLRRVKFSQAMPYHFANHGRDRGASLDAVFQVIRDRGITTEDVIDPYDWQGRSWPADWPDLAEQYRIVEAWDCVDVDAIGSGLMQGHPSVLGVWWGSGGGHAIYIVGMKRERGTLRKFRIANSWGLDWGERGLGWLPESQVAEGLRYFGGWIPRFQRMPADDLFPAPPG